jgi:cytidine deaminase
MHDIEIKNLVRMAIDARDLAYAPYSGYRVGACAKGESGAYYVGCNVENVSYSLSMCAERAAIFKGISECEHRFNAMAVVGSTLDFPMPCGACRQVMSEFFSEDTTVIVANVRGEYKVYTLGELMPEPFVLSSEREDGSGRI